MKWLLEISLLFLTLGYVGSAFAHAVVTDHSLKIAQPQANQSTKAELTFNSKIEMGLSQVYLVSKGDKHTLLTISKGEKKGNVAVDIPPLSPGKYVLRYKIFAADGHLTEDVIHFSVSP
ncbi:copper resistance protein CopC [Methyloglobulus sp.]|uniref:copper resistance CopC family protein n=1 Tax=Methyloglobulus sp. TaxID=2518622 RepID=UPI003988ABC7